MQHKSYIITGTDTDIGKTVFAAALTGALKANYWKPVQSGLETIDTRTVQMLTNLPDDHFLPESYMLSEPLSPHLAAERDKVTINTQTLRIPDTRRPLIIEGAGGLMVPLTRKHMQINQFKKWATPVILCARTALGTLNHTLLSIEALWARDIPIHGITFIGEDNPDNIKTIADFSGEKILGRLPIIENLNAQTLQQSFKANFNIGDFL